MKFKDERSNWDMKFCSQNAHGLSETTKLQCVPVQDSNIIKTFLKHNCLMLIWCFLSFEIIQVILYQNSWRMSQNHPDREMCFWVYLILFIQFRTAALKECINHDCQECFVLFSTCTSLENTLLTEFFNLSAIYYGVLAGR